MPRSVPVALHLAVAAAQHVYREPAFDVQNTTGVTYAQGLTCAADQRSGCTAMSLQLEVFEPVAKAGGPAVPDLKPAYIVAHGGGNMHGSKEIPTFRMQAESFASRGFVAFNIDYRLASDQGLLPAGDRPTTTHIARWEKAYPAARDCKAAVRFVRANAAKYGVDPDRVAVSGGSAGAADMLAVGVTFESDYKDELSTEEDATLQSTHLGFSSHPQAVVLHWSTDGIVDLAQAYDPQNATRYTGDSAPIIEFHGDQDTTLPLERAKDVQAAYAKTGVDYELHVLEGCPHGSWCYDGKGACRCEKGGPQYDGTMDRIALPFVAKHLKLDIVDALQMV